MSVILMISAIDQLLSPISLFWTYAGCYNEITLVRTFLSLAARALEISLQSTFSKKIGRQFLINLFPLSFIFFQNVTKNYFVSPSFPDDPLSCILSKDINSYFSVSPFSHSVVSLKLRSHGILHYLCSADLAKSFFQVIVSIFTMSQYFFNRFVR